MQDNTMYLDPETGEHWWFCGGALICDGAVVVATTQDESEEYIEQHGLEPLGAQTC